MAQLDFYRQRVAAPQVQAAASPQSYQGSPHLAQAVSDLGNAVAKAEEYGRVQKITSVHAAALSSLDEFQFELEQDQDYATHYQRFEEHVNEVDKAAKAQFGNDSRAYSMWKTEFTGPALAKGFEVRRGALKGQIGQARANLDQQVTTFAGLGVSGNPDQDAFAKQQGMLAIDDALAAGVITPEEAFKRTQGFTNEILLAGIRRDLLVDPESTEANLLAGGYADLQGEDRVKMMELAGTRASSEVTRRLTEQTRAEAAALRQEKIVWGTTAKEGDALFANGQLSADWIEGNQDNLSPSDYRYFTKALRGGGSETDVEVYADLRARAGNGEDVREETRDALTSGRLKIADHDKIIGVVEGRTSAGSSWYTRGEDFISTALKPSPMVSDPEPARRMAEGLDAWKQWSDDNPNAKPEEASKEYRRIVNEFSLVKMPEALTKRAPTFLVGNRAEPDIDATEEATVAAFEAGSITQEEFAKQSALLNEWRDAIEKQKAAESKAE